MQYINNLRAIAIMMIIFTHSLWALPGVGDAIPLLDFLVGNGTIVFIYIAGYLFYQTTDDFHYIPFLKNKLLTVVLPYLIVSLPATLLYVLELKTYHRWLDMDWYFSLGYIQRYLYMAIMGASLGPLWFIPMIVLFYIASPVFLPLKQSRLLIPIFLVALAVAYMTGRPEGNNNPFHSCLFYLAPYLLGMIVARNEAKLQPFLSMSLPVLIGYIGFQIVVFLIVFHKSREATDSIAMLFYIPLVLLMTMACKNVLNRKIPILDMFARLSFFLFFIHGYFAGFARLVLRITFGENVAIANPIMEFFVAVFLSLLITFMCLLFYVVLKYITKSRSRYLIGA